ncbi:uncharacterized protein LOC141674624 [Apium graveolens]|uniref:uncharacterized protein LOC141674624 n=1 Tax=Apium graveolens TaxID=4045 RepID=UPI003D795073
MIIINSLKKRFSLHKGKWVEELSWVLWADRTTPKTSMGQTPYSLVYDTKVVLSTEIIMPTLRCGTATYDSNKKELTHDIDTIDKLRETTKIRMAMYQQKIARSYNKNIHIRNFQVGDMVMRKVFQNTMDVSAGKFADT